MLRVLGRQAAGRIPTTTQQTLSQYESMITGYLESLKGLKAKFQVTLYAKMAKPVIS